MITDFEQVTRALAHRNRIRILKILEGGELCVCQITAVLGLANATVSKHLSVLRHAGLIFARQEGRWVYCRLAEHPRNPHVRPVLSLARSALGNDPDIIADRDRLLQIQRLPLDSLCGTRNMKRAIAEIHGKSKKTGHPLQ